MNRPLHGGNLVWASRLADCSPDAILDFSASINPLGPPASAIAAIHGCLEDLRGYPDPAYSRLRVALSQFHPVSPDWILPGNGAAELLTWAGRDLAELPTTVLLTPAFSDYQRALKAFGATVVEIPLEWTASTLNRTLQNYSSTAHGILLNNPHNPTGQLFTRKSILPLLERFSLVVVDEAFMDFLPPGQDESVIEWVAEFPNLVVLRSLTKFYSLPGLRLGYAIAHPDRLQRWQQWRDPWSVNAIAAAVGEVVVSDLPFQQQTWNWLAEARPALFAGLASLPGLQPFPSAANFLLVRSARSVTDLQTELLKQHQVFIRDCISFAELGDRYFRTAVRTTTENQQLLNGLSDILSVPPTHRRD